MTRRDFYIVASRLALGLVIGPLVAASYWCIHLHSQDKSVVAALNGQVEDAIGLLTGLLALGTVVGVVVGIIAGHSARMDKDKA